MGGIRLCGYGCVCQWEDPFIYFGAKPTQRACAQDLPRVQRKTREGKSKSQTREVDRPGRSSEDNRKDQSTEENREDSRREQGLGLWTQAGLANVRRWARIPSVFVGISFEFTLEFANRSLEC